MATTGWWSQYRTAPASGPYADYLNSLGIVMPAPAARAVLSPEITPEGIVRTSGGDVSTPTTPSSEGLTVGQATAAHQQSGFQHGSPIPGGLVGKGDMAGLMLGMTLAGVPSLATTLFSVSNALAGWGTGFNTDPTTGARINSPEFQAIRADPMVNTVINPSLAAISPLAMATVGPIGASQPGFSTSPFALGTPFGMPFTPSQWNTIFGPRESQDPNAPNTTAAFPDAPPGFPGVTDPNAGWPDAPGAGTTTTTGPTVSSDPSAMHRGGVVTRLRSGLEQRIRAQAGEYVVRRGPATKYRALLEAINRDRPAEVRPLASKLQARLVA